MKPRLSSKGKRALLCGALFLLFLAAVLGFALPRRSSGPVTLRVWVERTLSGSSIHEIQPRAIEQAITDAAAAYEAAHENVHIELEYLPDPIGSTMSSEERQMAVQHIRNEIMGGAGPDIFLSAVSITHGDGWEGVFTDVEGSMRDGLFYDISGYYDADGDLQGSLNAPVMAAGRLGDAQYVLPMRYSYPVLYVDRAAMEAAGLDLEALNTDTYTLYDTLLATGDKTWFRGLYPERNSFAFTPFGDVFDYETCSPLLSQDQLADYLGRVEDIRLKSQGTDMYFYSPSYTSLYDYIANYDYPLRPIVSTSDFFSDYDAHTYTGMLHHVFGMIAASKKPRVDLAMYPLRSIDGELVANVTYWGAVSANTKHPQEAYDFLRLMLMPEAQSAVTERNGWPVRTDVTMGTLWPLYQEQLKAYSRRIHSDEFTKERIQQLMKLELTDDDFPLADAEITRARFVTRLEYDSWNTFFYGGDPETTAKELYERLYWHIGER